jgi:hypothetical protein
MHEVIMDEERYIITGNATTFPFQFDGIDTQIVTNVIDDNNSATGFTDDLVDRAIKILADKYSLRPTAIYCGWGMKRKINAATAGGIRVNIDQSNSVSSGVEVGSHTGMTGKVPYIPTFAIAGNTTAFPTFTVENMYIVTEKAQ